MRISRLLLVVFSFFFVAGIASIVTGGVPTGTDDISLDKTDGDKGAVKFPHAKHATEFKKNDGSAITCQDCHHTLTEATPADGASVKSCSSCHVKEGEAQVDHAGKKASFVGVKDGDKFDKKSLIFHKNCLDGCHKDYAAKKISSCKSCHG